MSIYYKNHACLPTQIIIEEKNQKAQKKFLFTHSLSRPLLANFYSCSKMLWLDFFLLPLPLLLLLQHRHIAFLPINYYFDIKCIILEENHYAVDTCSFQDEQNRAWPNCLAFLYWPLSYFYLCLLSNSLNTIIALKSQ